MKLGYTILYVLDVEKTIEFYENTFGLNRLFIHESGDYGEYICECKSWNWYRAFAECL